MSYKWINKRNFLGFLAFIALSCLGLAYSAEYLDGVTPCQMCLYERYLYWIVAAVGFIGLVFPRYTHLMMRLTGFILIVGIGVAIYHLGIENHWWASPAMCGGIPLAQSPEQFLANLKNRPLVRCDEIGWRIFGISATILNLAWYGGFLLLWLGAYCFHKKFQK